MNKLIISIVGIVVVGFIIVLSRSNKMEKPTQVTPSPTAITQETTTPTSAVKTINVEAGSFYYNPKEIRVKKGEKVKIILTGRDMMHNFNINEFDVHSPMVNSGETTSIEFTASQTGSFEYYCSVGSHRQRGQVGTLIVE